MERILNIKVDLECPDEAKFAIDKAVETYNQSKIQWTAHEINQAKSIALGIMHDFCEEGYSIDWTYEIVTETDSCIMVWISHPDPNNIDCFNNICTLDKPLWDIWVAKCIALCKATNRAVPKFITDKAGEGR